jgi:hypothetical protein
LNTVKAAWNAVSVPAQSGEPTCSGAGTVSVANPGSQTGPAVSLPMSATSGAGELHLIGHGAPGRPVDQHHQQARRPPRARTRRRSLRLGRAVRQHVVQLDDQPGGRGSQQRSFNVGDFATVKLSGTEDSSLQGSFVLDGTAVIAG